VNGFDVHAVGWLVTRDLSCHAACALLGLRPAIAKATLEGLWSQWRDVTRMVDEDLAAGGYGARVLQAGATPLSRHSEAAMREFFRRLVAFRSDKYAASALRGRCAAASLQMLASFLCCVVLNSYAAENPTFDQAALAFLLVGCWYLMTGLQLFRAHRLTRLLGCEQATAQNRTE
jgi:hypothetical protein